jgi:hypothetical protein
MGIKNDIRESSDSEEWRPVEGFKYYEVSSLGRVRSKKRTCIEQRAGKTIRRTYKSKVLKPGISSNGYLVVTLSRKGKTETRTVHRLVAGAFLASPARPDMLVLHKDDNKSNNVRGNLRWGDYSDNMLDRERNGIQIYGEDRSTATFTNAQVRRIARLISKGATNQEIATLMDCPRTTINNIRRGTAWSSVTGIQRKTNGNQERHTGFF